MVEPVNYMDCATGEENLDNMLGIESKNILNILDFPMESLEGDGIVGDWDAGNSQCLGPIPSDVLMAPPIDIGPPYLLPPPIDGESGVFQIENPVSEIERIGSYSAGKSLPNKSDDVIPVRTRSKRVKSSRVSQWHSFERTSTSKMTSNARKSKGRRKKYSRLSVAMETMNDSIQVSDHIELQNASKKCTHCEVTKTPQWREGPMGPKTLCNACGVRFRSGRLFPEYRPAASPTFVPSLHSNSHKKVIEMRNQATKIKEPLVPAAGTTDGVNIH